jgi:hypothetical protein
VAGDYGDFRACATQKLTQLENGINISIYVLGALIIPWMAVLGMPTLG